jgi:cytochrome bd-type quinol oxidase subunit 2
VIANFALAQVCAPNQTDPTQLCNPTGAYSLDIFLKDNLLSSVAGVLGIIVIIMIVYSGVRMILSQGNEEQLAKAKTTFQWSLVGLLIIVLAFVLITAISKFLNVQEIPTGTTPLDVQNPIQNNSLYDFILTILQNFLPVAAIIAMLFLIITGFRYITARGNEEQTTAAKQGLFWSVIGLIIILLAYVIVSATLKLVNGENLYTTGGRVITPPGN